MVLLVLSSVLINAGKGTEAPLRLCARTARTVVQTSRFEHGRAKDGPLSPIPCTPVPLMPIPHTLIPLILIPLMPIPLMPIRVHASPTYANPARCGDQRVGTTVGGRTAATRTSARSGSIAPVFVLCIDAGAVLEQALGDHCVALDHGMMQWRIPASPQHSTAQ